MRLTRLRLQNYGNFRETTLRFDPAPERLNLVLAPNGAGKSVLRGAFGDLLFGIGTQTPMAFRHGYAGMQVSAEGLLPDGTALALTRRKGRGNTLLGPDEAPLDAALQARLLGGTDRALLERLFALDTERLRAGGQGLLASGGALAEALLEAAGGLRQAQALRQDLQERRDQLAPARKLAQRPFYMALERLAGSRRRLKEGLVRPERWLEQERGLTAARTRREAASLAALEAARTLHRLERVRRLRPLLARHDAAAAWLALHADAPRLAPALQARLPQARQATTQAALAREAQHRRHAELAAQAEAVVPEAAVLAQAERIGALLEAAGAAEKAQRDLPALDAELRSHAAQMEALLRTLGLAWPASRAAEAVPPAPVLARAWRLVREHARHAEALAALPRVRAGHAAALQKAETALAGLPPPRDAEVLAALAAAASAEGDPAKAAGAVARASAQAAARLEAALARLPAPWRALPALRSLEPPSLTLVRQQAAHLAAARQAQQEQAAHLARSREALAASRQEREGLGREGPLPDAATLAAARARRDAGWALVYRRAFGEGPDLAAERAFGEGQPLPLAYAAALAEADRIADLRNAEAGRVGAAEGLDRRIAAQEQALDAARAAETGARQQAAAAAAGWAALLRPLALDPATDAAELEQLLVQRATALDLAAEQATAQAAEADLHARQAADAGRLRQALDLAATARPDLPALLAEAEARQRDSRRTEGERARLQAQREAAQEGLAVAARDLAMAEEQMAAWHAAWRDTLAALGRAPGEHPDDCAEALRLLEDLAPLVREARSLTARIEGIRQETAAFAAACHSLAGTLGLPGEAEPVALARALGQRLQAARGVAARRHLLERQRDEATEALRQAQEAATSAEAELRDAIAATGAGTPEAAEERLLQAVERERQEALQAEALREVLAAGDGFALDALRQEVAAVPPEGLEAELAQAREVQATQQAAAEDAAADTARAEAALAALGDEAGFAQAVQDQQAAVAQIGETLESALLLHTADALLEAALGQVQEAGDDRLLRRIGTVFARLTDGAYPAVASREDERGVAHLVIRRRDAPAEEALVDELSEGTRDQLFLALRLVAIEDQAAHGAPLPFLGDDILQSFDDSRAVAAFRTLLAFSQTTQVILLSHHPHLLALAREALAPGQVHVQQLEA